VDVNKTRVENKISVKQEFIIPREQSHLFENLYLVHFYEDVFYFVKYMDEDTMKKQGKLLNNDKINDSYLEIDRVMGFRFEPIPNSSESNPALEFEYALQKNFYQSKVAL